MANLRVKAFQVQVFRSGSLLEVEPDVCTDVLALTEVTAVQSVMRQAMMKEAGAVYVRCGDQERWFYEVVLVDGQLLSEYVV